MRFLAAMPAYERPELRTLGELLAWVDRVAFDRELLRRAESLRLDERPSVRSLIERRREGMLVELLYDDSVASRVQLSPDSVRAFYLANRDHYAIPESAEIWLAVSESRGQADSILIAARAGAELGLLARVHSLDRASARQGGKVRMERGNAINPEVEDAVFATAKGEFGGPIPVQDGWMVFKVLEKTPRNERSLEEVSELVKRDVRAREEERSFEEFLGRLKQRISVKTYPERLVAVTSGRAR